MKIWAHTIVNNEENFIWFAVMSVVDFVDKVLIYDTGSTDETVKIIEEIIKIKGKKVEFKQVGAVDKYAFTKMRQRMLEESDCDWILILDGDEIWWNSSIKKLVNEINKNAQSSGIVVPMVVPVGDIYHIQEEKAGRYKILGRTGHLSLKVINKKIPGLHTDLPYPKEGYFDEENTKIQERKDIIFLDAPFLHVTHLKRSSQPNRENKFKYELGSQVSDKFNFPEVFFREYPSSVRSPWNRILGVQLFRAKLLTPIRKLKRRILF